MASECLNHKQAALRTATARIHRAGFGRLMSRASGSELENRSISLRLVLCGWQPNLVRNRIALTIWMMQGVHSDNRPITFE